MTSNLVWMDVFFQALRAAVIVVAEDPINLAFFSQRSRRARNLPILMTSLRKSFLRSSLVSYERVDCKQDLDHALHD